MLIEFPHLLSTGAMVWVTMHDGDEFPEVLSGPGPDGVIIPYEILSRFDRDQIESAAVDVFLERRREIKEAI